LIHAGLLGVEVEAGPFDERTIIILEVLKRPVEGRQELREPVRAARVLERSSSSTVNQPREVARIRCLVDIDDLDPMRPVIPEIVNVLE
jgi:hypothetical protein